MRGAAIFAFRLASYLLFLASFAWLFCFVGDFWLPVTVDHGRTASSLADALAVDVGWFVLFAVQHSGMARERFKERWLARVPPETRRSIFVLVSALLLLLLCWQWRPLPAVVWDVRATPWRYALVALYVAGWAQLVTSSFFIDHFAMFGLREFEGPFATPYLYRWVRHPIYFGFLVMLWSTPHMTVGHVLLSSGMTAYILIGIRFEERDLVRRFGAQYAHYQERVPMLVPLPKVWFKSAALIAIGLMSLQLGCRREGNSNVTVHYVEIVSPDADALVGMYERVHGLSFGAPDPDLGQARVATRADGSLVGIRKPLAEHEHPIMRTYLAVGDIQQAVKSAAERGATIAYPPTRQGQRGTFAIVIQGGVEHGLWQR